MAQIFSSVSPEVTREFEIPYMQEVYSHFGSIYYGCCERLDDRLDVVEQMPNIRKVSCSPWSNREHFASVLSKKYIMSAKPNPAFLAAKQFDEELIRLDLRRTIRAARKNGLGLEFLLRQHRRTRKRKGPAGRFHPAGHIYAIPSALQPH